MNYLKPAVLSTSLLMVWIAKKAHTPRCRYAAQKSTPVAHTKNKSIWWVMSCSCLWWHKNTNANVIWSDGSPLSYDSSVETTQHFIDYSFTLDTTATWSSALSLYQLKLECIFKNLKKHYKFIAQMIYLREKKSHYLPGELIEYDCSVESK